jgi:hypothetical protein
MGHRWLASLGPVAASALLGIAVIATQSATGRESVPRTRDGRIDLQGTWLNDTATPLERPKEFAGKSYFTDAEARDYESHYQLDRAKAAAADNPFELEVAADLDVFEPGKVLYNKRTSLVTDPPDGMVPTLTPDARRRANARLEQQKTHYAENPENFPNNDRCLMIVNTAGPPMLPMLYDNNVQIVQTPDYLMVESEMIHDARVISLRRRTHLPVQIRQWKGDSIGHWEGETLVVDTTNFTGKTTIRGSGDQLHVVERFTLMAPNTLSYEFTVDDPASFVRGWSAKSAMVRTDGRMFEYSCHEGNYSIVNALRGARFAERNPPPHN